MNRKLLAVIASGALALPMATQVSALDINASGHINRTLLFGDRLMEDNKEVDVRHSDGGASPSRFRLRGSEDVGNGLSAGVNLEFGIARTSGEPGTSLRYSTVNLSGGFGTVTLGHGSEATDGVAYSNFDNSAWLAGIEITCDFCSNGIATFDGGRSQVVRFDSQKYGPGTVSVSTDADEFWDVMFVAAGAAGSGGKYEFKFGYADPSEPSSSSVVLSGAYGLSQGTHFNAAWGTKDQGSASNLSYFHFGAGHNMGNTSVAMKYDVGDVNSEADVSSWGVGIGHTMGSAQVYAGYTFLGYGGSAGGTGPYLDTSLFTVGTRVRFN